MFDKTALQGPVRCKGVAKWRSMQEDTRRENQCESPLPGTPTMVHPHKILYDEPWYPKAETMLT